MTQGSRVRLDHVALTLGNLFYIFSFSDIDEEAAAHIVASLEKRWKQADQDVFILAIFFNPYLRHSCFNPQTITQSHLYTIAERVFKRFFGIEPDLDFLLAFSDYWKADPLSEFSVENMVLDKFKAHYEARVSLAPLDGISIAHHFFQDEDIDLVLIWSRLDSQVLDGRNGVVKLAIRLLSVIANSGGCERVFSEFGITHTKRRNKLSPELVHKTAVLKAEMRRAHAAAGLLKSRKARVFGENGANDVNPNISGPSSSADSESRTPAPANEPHSRDQGDDLETDFNDIEAELINDAQAMQEYETYLNSLPILHSSASQPCRPIPLEKLFNYTTTTGDHSRGLGFYWKGGLRNLEKELAAYETIYESDIALKSSSLPPSSNISANVQPSS